MGEITDCACSLHGACKGGYVLYYCNNPEEILSFEEIIRSQVKKEARVLVEALKKVRSVPQREDYAYIIDQALQQFKKRYGE